MRASVTAIAANHTAPRGAACDYLLGHVPPRRPSVAVSRDHRETLSDWLMLIGGPLLAVSEFMVWSHQFSPGFLIRYGTTPALAGIPRDPTAWQVYSVVDVLLAVLAAGLFAVALRGARPARIAVLLGLVVGLLFTLHAMGTPPTKGADLYRRGDGALLPRPPVLRGRARWWP